MASARDVRHLHGADRRRLPRGVLVRTHRRGVHGHRSGDRRDPAELDEGGRQQLVELRHRQPGPDVARGAVLRVHGRDLREIGSGRATARRLRPADGPAARRRGAHRGGRRHDARRGHRRRRRHRDHDGHDLAAGDDPLRLRPQARHGRDRGLRHARSADPAEPRAARAGFELQGRHGRRTLPRGDGPGVVARRALRPVRRATWRSRHRRRHRRCRSRSAGCSGAASSPRSR